MLQPWSEVFRKDQIYVGIFDSAYLNNQSIIHDFITAINLPELVDDSARHITTNPSLNNKSALLLSNIRQHNLNRESRAYTKPNPTDYVTEADYLEAMRMYTQHLRENFQLKSVLINRSRTTSTLEHDSPLSIATQSQLDYVYELFRESNQQLITEYRPDVTLDIVFPRIIATQHVDYSDIEIMYHGFHILLEATEEFMEQHKGYNKILQQQNEHIRTHNKRLKHHTQMLWKTVRAHTETFEQVQQQFAGVQEQLTQVQHQLAQLQEQIIQFNTATHQINSRTNTIKYWIIRIWHKFIRRST
jgi:DNA repair exonuclease SbcCD ATPase subunit